MTEQNNAVETQNAAKYGKFNSAEELLRGYAELEKSYTKKCQELSKLKTENSGISAEASPQAEPTSNVAVTVSDVLTEAEQNPQSTDEPNASYVKAQQRAAAATADTIAKDAGEPKSEQADSGIAEQQGDEKRFVDNLQQFLRQNPDIARNLLQIRPESQPAPKVIGSGGAPSMAQPTRAKTLTEASRLALQSFAEN